MTPRQIKAYPHYLYSQKGFCLLIFASFGMDDRDRIYTEKEFKNLSEVHDGMIYSRGAKLYQVHFIDTSKFKKIKGSVTNVPRHAYCVLPYGTL